MFVVIVVAVFIFYQHKAWRCEFCWN